MKCPLVLVIRGEGPFSELLRGRGCDVINLELIKTEVLDDLSHFENAISDLKSFDGLFLTSPVAAQVFISEIARTRIAVDGSIYVLGDRTRQLFEDAGIEVKSDPMANTAEELIGGFENGEFAGKKLLFIRGDKSARVIPQLLADKANVDEVVVYKTIKVTAEKEVEDIAARLRKGDIGWICFFSPLGVEAFCETFELGDALESKIAAIGKTTAQRASDLGINVDFISPRSNGESFAKGLMEHIENA